MTELLSLPMYAELKDEMLEYVCENLKNAISLGAVAGN
jgi:dTDP-4-amino-4,6-dideoxygalactose transaminase